MNKDEVEAHSLFNKMQKQQALLAEFEKLGLRISVCPATCSGFVRPGVSV